MKDDNYNDGGQPVDNTRRVTRIYVVLSLISVVIMVIAAYITYGYQKRELTISYDAPEKKEVEIVNDITVSPDLSRVPSDKEIEKILNKALPDVCDDCDDDPLDCLDKYEINQIFIQNDGYQDQLRIDLVTGKNDAIYTVVIDLNNNAVLSKSGKIDKKMCFENPEEEEADQKVHLNAGDDPENSHYLDVPTPTE